MQWHVRVAAKYGYYSSKSYTDKNSVPVTCLQLNSLPETTGTKNIIILSIC